jgi:hypothetical protein
MKRVRAGIGVEQGDIASPLLCVSRALCGSSGTFDKRQMCRVRLAVLARLDINAFRRDRDELTRQLDSRE